MRILLDTHIFLWAVTTPEKLPARVLTLLEDQSTVVVVSAASALEIAAKYRLGKLPGAANVVADYAGAIIGLDAQELAISHRHALQAGRWDVAHRDPFDRMLAAQASIEAIPLATVDPALPQFGIELLQ